MRFKKSRTVLIMVRVITFQLSFIDSIRSCGKLAPLLVVGDVLLVVAVVIVVLVNIIAIA